jgi:glycosyltransferase involved in cell wall biosynthesis
MKNILVITNMYPSEKSNTFGIFVKNQVEALKNSGESVDVIAITDPRSTRSIVLFKYFKWMVQTLFVLLIKGYKYDVIHAHYVFPSGILALPFKLLFRKKLIVTAHGGDIDRMAKKNKWIRKATNYILHKADAVIAVGERLAEEIVAEYHVPKQDVHVLSMGVNRDIFKPIAKAEAKKSVAVAIERKVFLFVGNLIKEKGILELIEAFKKVNKQIDNSLLVIIGNKKHEPFYEQMKKDLAPLLEDDYIIMPAISQEELAVWMNAADAFVLPSHMEGFGLVAVEAMSCHTPVIASDVGGLSYLLCNGAGKLIQKGDVAALSKSMEYLLSNQQESEKMIRKATEVAKKHDEKNVLTKLLAIYNR